MGVENENNILLKRPEMGLSFCNRSKETRIESLVHIEVQLKKIINKSWSIG